MRCPRKPPATKRRGRHPLNALSARSVRAFAEAGWYCDGHGLYLIVQTTGSRSWIQRLTIRGRRRELGLGGFPGVSLKQARAQTLANLQVVRAGGDPLADKRQARGIPTFADAAAQVWKQMAPGWRNQKHGRQWLATLERYVFPRLGERPICDITSAEVLEILTPIWHQKPETARRVRQRIGAVMEWAVAMECRPDNPCDRLKKTLPRQKDIVQHMRALPHGEVAAAIAKVQESGASRATRLLFEFLVLTAARSGEARLARWDEIALDAKVWRIPATRMKANREHRVPLSARAMQILEMAQPLRAGSDLVFPSPRGRAFSDATLSKLLREQGIPAVPHGFRSSFRNWCSECTDHPREVVEAALAHVVRDKVEAAYLRSDLLHRRRLLLDEWATYLRATQGRPRDAVRPTGRRSPVAIAGAPPEGVRAPGEIVPR